MSTLKPQEQLATIAGDLSAGREPPTVTVRDFLSWFGAQRRGWSIVASIKDELDRAGLVTDPDFEGAYIDSLIHFKVRGASATAQAPQGSAVEIGEPQKVTEQSAEPAYRISKLAAANSQPVSVPPTTDLQVAITLMMANDYSQLPVMIGERDVKGMISWKSIGSRLALGVSGGRVAEYMDNYQEIRSDESIFRAIQTIVEHDYVLVRGPTNKIVGIVTASDLSIQFRNLSEPFLLIGEIEHQIRQLIRERFSMTEIVQMRDGADSSRQIDDVSDLTFGEYVRGLDHPERWSKLGVRVDRSTFCRYLDDVRKIRNDVMHFDPDGIPPEDLKRLRDFAAFIHRLQSLSLKAI